MIKSISLVFAKTFYFSFFLICLILFSITCICFNESQFFLMSFNYSFLSFFFFNQISKVTTINMKQLLQNELWRKKTFSFLKWLFLFFLLCWGLSTKHPPFLSTNFSFSILSFSINPKQISLNTLLQTFSKTISKLSNYSTSEHFYHNPSHFWSIFPNPLSLP